MPRGGVLDVDRARREQGGIRLAFDPMETRRAIDRNAGDLTCGGKRIDPQECLRRPVVPLHQGDGLLFAEGGFPTVEQPVRMRERDRRRQIGHLIHQPLAREHRPAQHGVDESPHAGLAGLHRFIDRRMIGQPEDQDLAQAHAQHIAGLGVEFAFAEFRDPVV